VKVIIPLAGKGTRLRPHTYTTPKPLLRVGGKPVMSYILDDLRELGVDEIIFITGYLKENIEKYVARAYPEFKAHYVEQPVQNGTAGAVWHAREFIDSDVLIMFVDTLFDADLSLIKRLPADSAGVIWAKEVEDYQRYGVIVRDENNNMKRIVEKPTDPVSKLANIGLYYIKDWKLLFRGIEDVMEGPAGKTSEYYLTDAFQFMVDQGAKIRVEEVTGWYDCGQPETWIETNKHLLENKGRALAPQGGRNVKIHKPVRICEGVTLENAEIGPNVTIEEGSVLKNVKIRDSIIGLNAHIEGSDLHNSLIGDNTVVNHVSGVVNIGDHSTVDGTSK
jgi:glucose-1-phosphate thymidylyltransferase